MGSRVRRQRRTNRGSSCRSRSGWTSSGGGYRWTAGQLAPRRAPAPVPGLGYLVMLAAALFALMLPIAGPLDDHHFAERMPAHGHIYPDGRPVPHQHFYQSPAGHRHSPPPGVDRDHPGYDAGAAATLEPAAGLLLAAWSAPYHPAPDALRPPAARGKDDNRRARFAAPFRRGEGISVWPPHRPPVA